MKTKLDLVPFPNGALTDLRLHLLTFFICGFSALSFSHNFVLLDAHTGKKIEGETHVVLSFENSVINEHTCEFPHVDCEFVAPGYKRFTKRFNSCDPKTYHVFLTPLTPEYRTSIQAIQNKKQFNSHYLCGFISDQEGNALEDAEITTADMVLARTKADGFFECYIELIEPQSVVNLDIKYQGTLCHSLENVTVWQGGDWILNQSLNIFSDTPSSENCDYHSNSSSLGGQNNEGAFARSTQGGSEILCDIDMVTVGFNSAYAQDCCVYGTNQNCNDCGYYSVIPIDEYAKHVITAEWLAGNWQNLSGIEESYKAAAVAIKTYAAFLVLNPLCADFDVCDGPCCQAFSSLTNTLMNQSVDQASGYFLWDTPNGEEALAQYSSENNNLSGYHCIDQNVTANGCGNGFFGRSVTGIECFPDVVGTGYIQYGHGKGLSQVGSARWATGLDLGDWCSTCGGASTIYGYCSSSHGYGTKDWLEILEHYYSYYDVVTCAVSESVPDICDLEITLNSGSLTVCNNQEVDVSVDFCNCGTVSALDVDFVYLVNGEELESDIFFNLSPGECGQESESAIPISFDIGSSTAELTVIAYADGEENISNNLFTLVFTQDPNCTSEISLIDVTANTNPICADTPTSIEIEYQNTGNQTINLVEIEYYIDGSLVGNDTESNLAPGEIDTEVLSNASFNSPGSHEFCVHFNSDNNIEQIFCETITVEDCGNENELDASVVNWQVSPDYLPEVSGTVNLTYEVCTEYYSEPELEILIYIYGEGCDEIFTGPLNETTNINSEFTCIDETIGLSGLPAGYYCAQIHLDPNNQVVESNEQNNSSDCLCFEVYSIGCTDPSACNYDEDAVEDDGSCDFDSCFGCTESQACNFDPEATVDDGSCLEFDECGICGGQGTAGCTDQIACNYNPLAACDDGSCLEFDECGNCGGDDTAGCTDYTACNYDPDANCSDNTCLYNQGCTDMEACNYDENADCDDGSCTYPDGCTDMNACNYDPNATCDDGSCLPAASFEIIGPEEVSQSEQNSFIVQYNGTVENAQYTWSLTPGTVGEIVSNDNNSVVILWSEELTGAANICVTANYEQSGFNCSPSETCFVVNVSVGISEESSEPSSIVITPNPSNGVFLLTNKTNQGILGYSIFDMRGRLVLQGQLSQTEHIDLSSYESGTYILVAKNDQVVAHEKLVVRK